MLDVVQLNLFKNIFLNIANIVILANIPAVTYYKLEMWLKLSIVL